MYDDESAYVDRCESQIFFLEEKNNELRVEIERLRAIVNKLPRTTDGVPIVLGMRVWRAPNRPLVIGTWQAATQLAGDCFSTSEAAEEAKK